MTVSPDVLPDVDLTAEVLCCGQRDVCGPPHPVAAWLVRLTCPECGKRSRGITCDRLYRAISTGLITCSRCAWPMACRATRI